MNSKEKSWTYHPLMKGIAILLIWLSVAMLLGCVIVGDRLGYTLMSESYYETYEFKSEIMSLLSAVDDLEQRLISPDNIREIADSEAMRRKLMMDYEERLKTISKLEGLKYFYEDMESGKISSNIQSKNKQVIKDLEVSYFKVGYNTNLSAFYNYSQMIDNENLEIWVGYNKSDIPSSSYLDKKSDEYDTNREYALIAVAVAAVSLIVSLLMFVYLCTTTGRRSKHGEIFLGYFDRLPFDLVFIVLLCIDGGLSMSVYLPYSMNSLNEMLVLYIVACVAISTVATIHLTIFLSMIRQLKVKSLFRNMIVVRMLIWCYKRVIRPVFTVFIGGLVHTPLQVIAFMGYMIINVVGVLIMFNSYSGMAFIVFIFLVSINLGFLFLYVKTMLSIKRIRKMISRLSEGDLSITLDDEVISFLQPVVNDLSSIHDAALKSGERAIKNEKFKVGLIANVSHDLKTPLTSIITYVNLLDELSIDNQEADEYIGVLKDKSWRMKQLIDDVIDVNKSQTGNLKMDYKNIDGKEFLRQIIGEYNAKFDECNMTAVTNMPDSSFGIYADGNHLRRVFENLFENATRYGLPGTRVYIDTELIDDNVVFTIKNIAAEALTITDEEAKERFTRGDSSRTTEGSGLGIAIADGIVKQHQGVLDIIIDGDLFKVVITLKTQSK